MTVDGIKLADTYRQLRTDAEKTAFVARLSPEEFTAAMNAEMDRFGAWTRDVSKRLDRLEAKLGLAPIEE